MKTLPLQANHQSLARLDGRERQTTRTFPLTDCHYQTAVTDVKPVGTVALHRAALRNFRTLSVDFMAGETRRDYVAEATLFAIMTALVTWPLFSLLALLAEAGGR